jgi:hypothetical protein
LPGSASTAEKSALNYLLDVSETIDGDEAKLGKPH